MDIQVDPEIIKDFLSEFDEAYEKILFLIHKLDKTAHDKEMINDLFRKMHSIKSNLRMVGLNELSDLIHHLENILQKIRSEEFSYEPNIGHVIELLLEETKVLCVQYFNQKSHSKVDYLINALEKINEANDKKSRDEVITLVLNLLDSFSTEKYLHQSEKIANILENDQCKLSESLNKIITLNNSVEKVQDDLYLFKDFTELMEKKFGYSKNWHELILKISLNMLKLSKDKLPEDQLTAAVYMREFGLINVSKQFLDRKNNLRRFESLQLEKYPETSALFVKGFQNWDIAAEIILQHREKKDGSGYPKKLKDNEICTGAKILSIMSELTDYVQTYRSGEKMTRVLLKGIMEINKKSGIEFEEHWINLFNEALNMLRKT